MCYVFRRSLRPRFNKFGGRRGWGGFSPCTTKSFLRLRLGGWMTRIVIGDFLGLRWFYSFSLNQVYLRGLGGRCILTLFVAATDGPRNDPSPFGFICTIEGSSNIYREIGRAPLFCRLLLPLSEIPQICYGSNPQRATQQ